MDKLKKLENKLVHTISASSDVIELQRAAERVKKAKLLVLKGMRYYALDSGAIERTDLKRIKEIDEETEDWKTKTIQDIIKTYKKP